MDPERHIDWPAASTILAALVTIWGAMLMQYLQRQPTKTDDCELKQLRHDFTEKSKQDEQRFQTLFRMIKGFRKRNGK